MSPDRATEAAAKALCDQYEPYSDEAVKAMSLNHYRRMARIAVEAATPHLTEEAAYHAKCAWEQTDAYYEHLSQQILEAEERAERAEDRVKTLWLTIKSLWATEPWQMADLLAEALRKSVGSLPVDEDGNPNGPSAKQVALAAYEEARREH